MNRTVIKTMDEAMRASVDKVVSDATNMSRSEVILWVSRLRSVNDVDMTVRRTVQHTVDRLATVYDSEL